MKISIVNPHFLYIQGGAEINDLKLGQALRSAGHEVVHLAAFDKAKPQILHEEIPHRKVHMSYWYFLAQSAPGIIGKILRHLFESMFMKKTLNQEKAWLQEQDLILLTGRALLSQIAEHTPAIVMQSIRGTSNSRYWKYYYQADGIIYWGGCEEDQPANLRDDLQHINLSAAIDSDIFHPEPADPELRRTLQGNEPPRIVMVFVGRLDPEKQVQGIIEAVITLGKRGLPLRLIVIGDGSIKKKLETLASQSLPPGSILFMGNTSRDKIAEILRAADIFVMNSKTENDPIALKEAIACGIYAIAPNIGRVARRIKTTGFGQTFPACDQNALESLLGEVIADHKYAPKPKSTHSFDTWDKNAEKIIDFTKKIIKYEI